MVSVLLALHLLDIDSPCSNSLLNFKPNLDLKLFVDFCRLIFWCMFHLSANGPFGMVFKHLQDSFDPKDLMNGLNQLHQLCSHVAMGHILGSMTRVLGTSRLLVLTKPSSGIHPIVVEEVFYLANE